MKPINYNDSGCDPISSNCVLWQGPDIECINLCKGDTVSEVVYRLATELCNLLDKLSVDSYDLTCLDLKECAPDTFEQMIQILIDRICECCGVNQDDCVGEAGGCPDCLVPICEDFYYTNPQGDTVTTMQLKDYVIAIGNRVCQMIDQIDTINDTLTDHEARIVTLENAPAPSFDLPQITPTCVVDPVPTDIDAVLIALEAQFCDLRNFTGFPADILNAIQKQCAQLNSADQLNGGGAMQDINGWNSTVSNLAQSFNNAWLTICDLRSSVQFILNNCCSTDCGAVNIDMQVSVISSTEIRIDFVGSIPGTFIDGSPSSTITITDSAGGGPQTINSVGVLSNYYNTSTPYFITLNPGLNANNDINVNMVLRVEDPAQGLTCETIVQAVGLGLDSCPQLLVSSVSFDQASLSFTWAGTNTLVTLEIWNASETMMLQSQVISVATGQTYNPIITGLSQNTTYSAVLVINGEKCEFVQFTTLEVLCAGPTLGTITIDLDNPIGE